MPTSNPDPKIKPPRRLGRSPWLLALAVLVVVGVLVLVGWLFLNQAGGGTRQIEGDGIRLTIPEDWVEEDISTNESCQTETLECVAILSAPQGYNFSLTWYDQFTESSVAEVDEREWAKFREYYVTAILFSKDDLTVGGLPAIQRTFLQTDTQSTPIYFRQVYIVAGLRLYLITARFFSAEMMEAQAGVVDKVIESIEFTSGE
jgi:hypothetical protein